MSQLSIDPVFNLSLDCVSFSLFVHSLISRTLLCSSFFFVTLRQVQVGECVCMSSMLSISIPAVSPYHSLFIHVPCTYLPIYYLRMFVTYFPMSITHLCASIIFLYLCVLFFFYTWVCFLFLLCLHLIFLLYVFFLSMFVVSFNSFLLCIYIFPTTFTLNSPLHLCILFYLPFTNLLWCHVSYFRNA